MAQENQQSDDLAQADNMALARQTRAKRFRLFAAAIAVAAAGGGGWWLLTHNHETSDDAFIENDVVTIAPQVGGVVQALHFTDNQQVRQGDPLLEIDPRDYQAQFDAAQADLDAAQAQVLAAQADLDLTRATTGAGIDEARSAVEQADKLVTQARQQADAAQADAVRADKDVLRYDELVRSSTASRQRQEQAVADARASTARWKAAQTAVAAAQSQAAQTRARLADALAAPQRIAVKEAQLAQARAKAEQAEAALTTARINLGYTRIAAPRSGRVTTRAVHQGDLVQRGQSLANLVVGNPWVVANFKETQLARMLPGQPVTIRIDAFSGERFQGHVDSLQAGTGSRFSLLPSENATGNYVKVVQRVPVKIVFDTLSPDWAARLSPGMSVVPDVDVGVVPDQK